MPKKNSQSTLSKGFNAVDLFEMPVRLNMEGESSLTSAFGGMVSIIVILALLSQAIIQLVNITERKNPGVVQMDEHSNNPSRISLGPSNNFIFAIATTQSDQLINMSSSSLISFTATYSQQYRSKDGSLQKRKNKILWAPCSQSQFPTDVFPQDTFSTNSLQYAYCPTEIDYYDATKGCPDDIKEKYPDCKTPLNFGVQGNFLSSIFEYLQIQVKSCDPSDIATTQDLKCTSESISNIFNTSEIKLNLYYANNFIDPVDYKTPNNTYLDTIYWHLSPSTAQVADIFIDTITIQDYDDYIDTKAYQNRTFYSVSSEKVRELQAFKQSNMLQCSFRRSNLNSVTIRKYDKIQDVVSNIGGLSKTFLVVGAFLSIGYVRYKSQMVLSNKLYDFDLPEKKKKKMKKTKKSGKDEELPKTSVISNLLNINSKSKQKSISKSENSVKNYFDTQLKQSKKLKYGELQYFRSLLNMLCCRRSIEDKLAEKAKIQVTKDLDIVKIVEKLKEIDKLKRLLLNRYQRQTFDYIEKPLISIEEEKPIENGSFELIGNPESTGSGEREKANAKDKGVYEAREKYDTVSKYSKLYLAYSRLKQDSDPRSWKYNKKLINMMGEHLREVFEKVDMMMEGTPDPERFEEVVQKMINGRDLLDKLLTQQVEQNAV